jgi:hypothetical protein
MIPNRDRDGQRAACGSSLLARAEAADRHPLANLRDGYALADAAPGAGGVVYSDPPRLP